MNLLIFDVDGVLEVEEDINRARRENIKRFLAGKLDIPIEKIGSMAEQAKKDLPDHMNSSSVYIYGAIGLTREEYFRAVDEIDPAGRISRHKNCKKALESLYKENYLVTLSNSPRRAANKTLEILGIGAYFKKNYSSEDFEVSKPSTEILEKILTDCGFMPGEAYSIGNSLKKDIIPAHEYGIKTILFDPFERYDLNDKPKEADYLIRDLYELVDIVQKNI